MTRNEGCLIWGWGHTRWGRAHTWWGLSHLLWCCAHTLVRLGSSLRELGSAHQGKGSRKRPTCFSWRLSKGVCLCDTAIGQWLSEHYKRPSVVLQVKDLLDRLVLTAKLQLIATIISGREDVGLDHMVDKGLLGVCTTQGCQLARCSRSDVINVDRLIQGLLVVPWHLWRADRWFPWWSSPTLASPCCKRLPCLLMLSTPSTSQRFWACWWASLRWCSPDPRPWGMPWTWRWATPFQASYEGEALLPTASSSPRWRRWGLMTHACLRKGIWPASRRTSHQSWWGNAGFLCPWSPQWCWRHAAHLFRALSQPPHQSLGEPASGSCPLLSWRPRSPHPCGSFPNPPSCHPEAAGVSKCFCGAHCGWLDAHRRGRHPGKRGSRPPTEHAGVWWSSQWLACQWEPPCHSRQDLGGWLRGQSLRTPFGSSSDFLGGSAPFGRHEPSGLAQWHSTQWPWQSRWPHYQRWGAHFSPQSISPTNPASFGCCGVLSPQCCWRKHRWQTRMFKINTITCHHKNNNNMRASLHNDARWHKMTQDKFAQVLSPSIGRQRRTGRTGSIGRTTEKRQRQMGHLATS